MSAAIRFPSHTPPTRIPMVFGAIAGAKKASPGLAIALLAFCFFGCASSFCGAPCEAGAAPAARPAHPPENHFGTRFGHLDTWNMSPVQLLGERAELESLLGADSGDKALLMALGDRKGGADSWIYDGFHAGGSRFRANGKLRREVGIEDVAKRVMIGIEESPRRDLFERYRLVRMQLLTLYGVPPEADSAGAVSADSAVAEAQMAETPDAESAGLQAGDTTAAEAATTSNPAGGGNNDSADVPPPVAEGSWSGFYRANSGAPTAVPLGFAGLDECKSWAESKADEYRKEYFAFEFECRRDGRTFKRKMW